MCVKGVFFYDYPSVFFCRFGSQKCWFLKISSDLKDRYACGVNISRNGHNVYAAGATDIQLELSPLGPAKNQSINPNTGKIRISTTQNTLEALLALLWKTLRIAHTLRTSMIRPKNPPTSMSISAPCL
jgi:hypothetical protein